MKILITEIQFKSLINKIIIAEDQEQQQDQYSLELRRLYWKMEDWFVKILENLKEIKEDDFIYWVDKDNKIYMKYNKKNEVILIDYDKIWSYFESNYSDNYEEIQRLMRDLVGEHLNLWDATPQKYLL